MSKKYILNIDGTVSSLEKDTSNNTIKKNVDRSDLTAEKNGYTLGKNVFQDKGPDFNFAKSSTFGAEVGLTTSIIGNTSNEFSKKYTTGKDVFIKDENFPEGSGNFPRKDSFLLNSSFGADKDLEYETNFNSPYSDYYAGNLEILAGLDFTNFLGVNLETGFLDLSQYLFAIEFLIGSFISIILMEEVTEADFKTLGLSKSIKNLDKNKVYYYFTRVLNYTFNRKENYYNENYILYDNGSDGVGKIIIKDRTDRYFLRCIDFLSGFHEFLNADKFIHNQDNNLPFEYKEKYTKEEIINSEGFYGQVLKKNSGSFEPFELLYNSEQVSGFYLQFFNAALEILLQSFGKLFNIGEQRFFLLIRKFIKQRNFYRKTIKEKESSTNNPNTRLVDNFFYEHSQYYYKFLIERIHVGCKIKRKIYKSFNYRKIMLNREINTSIPLRHDSKYMYSGNKFNIESYTANKYERFIEENLKNLNSHKNRLKENYYNEEITQLSNLNKNRIPTELVRKVENKLSLSYMPFYFHDLRTNEILNFRAFLESTSDSYTPNYTESTGYGRIDKVKHYVDTTRSISFTFFIISTNPSDTPVMWKDINRLVCMVYPQYSDMLKNKGKFNTTLNDMESKEPLKYPFTDIPTNSPMIRIKVGNIIKSNFNEKTLIKHHGISNFNKIKNLLAEKERLIIRNRSIPDIIKRNLTTLQEEITELAIEFGTSGQFAEKQRKLNTNRKNINFLQEAIERNKKEREKIFETILDSLESNDSLTIKISNQINQNQSQIVDVVKAIKKLENLKFKLTEEYMKLELDFLSTANLLQEKSIEARDKNTEEIKNLNIFLDRLIQKQIYTNETSFSDLFFNNLVKSYENLISKKGTAADDLLKEQVNLTKEFSNIENKYLNKIEEIDKILNQYKETEDELQKSLGKNISLLDEIGNRLSSIAENKTSNLYKETDAKEEKLNKNINILKEENNSLIQMINILNKSLDKEIKKKAKENENITKELKKEVKSNKRRIKKITKNAFPVYNYYNNSPFKKSLDTNSGEGLAGFITNLDISYQEFNWDIDIKKPMGAKIMIQFSPIHDIKPGLDYDGSVRSNIY